MLTIQNINTLAGKYIGHWKIHNLSIGDDIYYIKTIHNGSPFDMFNLMIGRVKTSNGDYLMYCQETDNRHYLPIESIKNREEFVRFLIDELI